MNWTTAWHKHLDQPKTPDQRCSFTWRANTETYWRARGRTRHLIWCLLRCKMLLGSQIPSIGWQINELLIQNSKYLKSFFFFLPHSINITTFILYSFISVFFPFCFKYLVGRIEQADHGLHIWHRALYEKWGYQSSEQNWAAIDRLLFRYSNEEIKSQSHGGTRGSTKSAGQTVSALWICKFVM